MTRICEHGGLARKCEVCELREENARLREALGFKCPDPTLTEAQALALVMQALAVIARKLPEHRELAQRAREGVDALKHEGTRIRQDAIWAAVAKRDTENARLRALLGEARESVEDLANEYAARSEHRWAEVARNLFARIEAETNPQNPEDRP